MDAFESLIGGLLRNRGYWVVANYKVKLTRESKRNIGRPTSPRHEIDLLAYKPAINELLVIECKSFLNSRGVFVKDGKLLREETYKLFNYHQTRKEVFQQLQQQVVDEGLCPPKPRPRLVLCLAAGKIAKGRTTEDIQSLFDKLGWRLFGPEWIKEELKHLSEGGYENDVAAVVSKILIKVC